MKIQFKLEKAPKGTGGVKYAAEGFENFSIYVPQDVLAKTGEGTGFPDKIEVDIKRLKL